MGLCLCSHLTLSILIKHFPFQNHIHHQSFRNKTYTNSAKNVPKFQFLLISCPNYSDLTHTSASIFLIFGFGFSYVIDGLPPTPSFVRFLPTVAVAVSVDLFHQSAYEQRYVHQELDFLFYFSFSLWWGGFIPLWFLFIWFECYAAHTTCNLGEMTIRK